MAQGLGAKELAFLGDAVFELMLRERLVANGASYANLGKLAARYANANAQAYMYRAIFDNLTDDEQAVLKRGRNLHSASRSKNADVIAYRHSTGLEALFGFLHANGSQVRLREVFDMCMAVWEG